MRTTSSRQSVLPRPIALRDGFAVEAAAVADAGPYAPVLLASLPQRVEAGEPLPSGTDAVAPLDAVTLRGDRAEAIAPVVTGEGVLPAGGDAPAADGIASRRRAHYAASTSRYAAAAALPKLNVREPRICVARGRAATTPLIDAGSYDARALSLARPAELVHGAIDARS